MIQMLKTGGRLNNIRRVTIMGSTRSIARIEAEERRAGQAMASALLCAVADLSKAFFIVFRLAGEMLFIVGTFLLMVYMMTVIVPTLNVIALPTAFCWMFAQFGIRSGMFDTLKKEIRSAIYGIKSKE